MIAAHSTGWRPWLFTAVGVCLAAVYLFPVYWMFISGFKTSAEIFSIPPTYFPKAPTLASYRWVFERENVGRFLFNSFVIAGGATLLTLVIGSGASYALARVRSRWLDAVLVAIMVSQVLPPALLVTPMFVIFKQLGLLNTHLGVVIAVTTKTLPFAIVMLRTTFAQIPPEIEEAARVDGASRVGAFFRVVIPLARVGYIVVGTIVFLLAYGEFVYPVSLLSKAALQPATVGLYSFVGADYADWPNAMAFSSIIVAPVLLLFLFFQRRIVAGLTAGAVK
jgi:multiple sugar transport system permease protein